MALNYWRAIKSKLWTGPEKDGLVSLSVLTLGSLQPILLKKSAAFYMLLNLITQHGLMIKIMLLH